MIWEEVQCKLKCAIYYGVGRYGRKFDIDRTKNPGHYLTQRFFSLSIFVFLIKFNWF